MATWPLAAFSNMAHGRGDKMTVAGGDVIIPAANNPGCDAVVVDGSAAEEGAHIITFMAARGQDWEEMATAPPAADLSAKCAVLPKHGACAQAGVCLRYSSPTVLPTALDSGRASPPGAKFVSEAVLHRPYSWTVRWWWLTRRRDGRTPWCGWCTPTTPRKFYPPTFRHVPDLLSPGTVPAADLADGTPPFGIATRSFGTCPSRVLHSHAHARNEPFVSPGSTPGEYG